MRRARWPARAPRSRYSPAGNIMYDNGFSWFLDNVKPSACQVSTGDEWCSECSGAVCQQCFERASAAGAEGDPIVLHQPTGKVRRVCVPVQGRGPRCGMLQGSRPGAACQAPTRPSSRPATPSA